MMRVVAALLAVKINGRVARAFGLATLALGVASAVSTYSVKLYDPMWIGATEFKAGESKVEMRGDKAVFKMGKTVVEVPATVGKSGQKYATTSFLSENSKTLEIDLGGTTDKLLFSAGAGAQNAGGSKSA